MEKTNASSKVEPRVAVQHSPSTTGALVEIEQLRQASDELKLELKAKETVIHSQRVYIDSIQRKLSKLSERIALSEEKCADLKIALEYQKNRNKISDLESAKVRNTIAFQLGYALLHAFKSWSGVISLPRVLLGIRRETIRRRQAKQEILKPKSAVLATVSDRDWCHPFVKLRNDQGVSTGTVFMVGVPLSNNVQGVEITPQNFEFELPYVSEAKVNVFVNRNLLQSHWGNLFDFGEMQNFKRFLILRRFVNERGGKINIFFEEDIPIPLLSYVENDI
jgi:hypothetical protein